MAPAFVTIYIMDVSSDPGLYNHLDIRSPALRVNKNCTSYWLLKELQG